MLPVCADVCCACFDSLGQTFSHHPLGAYGCFSSWGTPKFKSPIDHLRLYGDDLWGKPWFPIWKNLFFVRHTVPIILCAARPPLNLQAVVGLLSAQLAQGWCAIMNAAWLITRFLVCLAVGWEPGDIPLERGASWGCYPLSVMVLLDQKHFSVLLILLRQDWS